MLYTIQQTGGPVDVSEAVLPEFWLGAQRARINLELPDVDQSLTGNGKLRAKAVRTRKLENEILIALETFVSKQNDTRAR